MLLRRYQQVERPSDRVSSNNLKYRHLDTNIHKLDFARSEEDTTDLGPFIISLTSGILTILIMLPFRLVDEHSLASPTDPLSENAISVRNRSNRTSHVPTQSRKVLPASALVAPFQRENSHAIEAMPSLRESYHFEVLCATRVGTARWEIESRRSSGARRAL
jgi:hypothetical protein